MTGLIGQRLADLRAARALVQCELEHFVLASALDLAALSRLREMVQQLKQEAHSLLMTLLFESAPPALADAADELLDRFCEVLQRVDAVIGQDQRTI